MLLEILLLLHVLDKCFYVLLRSFLHFILMFQILIRDEHVVFVFGRSVRRHCAEVKLRILLRMGSLVRTPQSLNIVGVVVLARTILIKSALPLEFEPLLSLLLLVLGLLVFRNLSRVLDCLVELSFFPHQVFDVAFQLTIVNQSPFRRSKRPNRVQIIFKRLFLLRLRRHSGLLLIHLRSDHLLLGV